MYDSPLTSIFSGCVARRYGVAGRPWVMMLIVIAGVVEFSTTIMAVAGQPSNEYIGHWTGSLSHKGREFAVALDISTDSNGLAATLDLPEHCLYGCPTVLSIEKDRLKIRASLVDAELTARVSENGLVGEANLFGNRKVGMTLRRANQTPRTYSYEDLKFKSGDAVLAGTIVKPSGRGSFPIIVWTHGSGPDTRRTFYYHARAHLMAQHGVASFIYDKRGAGESTGSGSWDIARLKEDAVAAVGAIASRKDVDAAHIGIAGFSQGGWVAPAVAARCQDIDFVVVGAAPGITGGEQNIFTLRNRLVAKGFNASEVEESIALLRKIYTFYQDGQNRTEVEAAYEGAKQKNWYNSGAFKQFLFMPNQKLPQGRHPYWQPFSPDPMEPWRRIRVPVFSVWGELDDQVPASLSQKRLAEALRLAGNNDHELIIYPSASHGLWVIRDDDTTWDWRRQVPGYHDTMVRWVLAHVAPSVSPSAHTTDQE